MLRSGSVRMRGSMTMHEMSTPSLPKLTDWFNKTAEQIVSNVHRCTHKTCRNHRQHSKKFLTKTYTTACGAITARKKTLRKRPNRHLRAGQSSQVKQNQTLRTLPPIPPIPPPDDVEQRMSCSLVHKNTSTVPCMHIPTTRIG